MLYIEILAVVVLTLVNGLLAMSELAVVSSRKSRLEQLAHQGNRGHGRRCASSPIRCGLTAGSSCWMSNLDEHER